jgi:gamma-glutamyl-gamma-aminobutyrate hydrolase PuuD
MNKHNHKPIVGILATPYISDNPEKQLFLTNNLIKYLNHNKIKHIVLPYNLSKIRLKNIVNKLDGLIFPGSQLGDYYKDREIKNHYNTQKFLINLIKKINKKRKFPILSICHGFQNLILIEHNSYPGTSNTKTAKKTKKILLKVNAYYNYKSDPKFTIHGKQMEKLYNKSKKLIHNNKLGISPQSINNPTKNNIKNRVNNDFPTKNRVNNDFPTNYIIYATNHDKNNKQFIEIVKHNSLPFYGFQAHPEINNTKLLDFYLKDINESFSQKSQIKINKNKIKTKKIKLNLIRSKVMCGDYGFAKKTSRKKCYLYNI